MSAGAVKAPLIIPLRIPDPGVPKSRIDTNTRLEILSETPNTEIYFTINGSKPVVRNISRGLPGSESIKFQSPFVLPAGHQVVRAVAFLPDTGMASSVVTKTFDVANVPPTTNGNHSIPDDYRFLEDLKNIESQRKAKNSARRLSGSAERTSNTHPRASCKSSRSLRAKPFTNAKPKTKRPALKSSDRCETRSPVICRVPQVSEDDKSAETSERENIKAPSAGRPVITFNDSPVLQHFNHNGKPDPTNMLRLQQMTDPLHCPNCFNRRPPEANHNFCPYCGHPLPRLPVVQPVTTTTKHFVRCSTCGANVPGHLNTCLMCANSLTARKATNINYQLCKMCHTANPAPSTNCLNCSNPLSRENPAYHPFKSVADTPRVYRPLNTVYPRNNTTLSGQNCPHCHRQNHLGGEFCSWCGLEMSVPSQTVVPNKQSPNTNWDQSNGMVQCVRCSNFIQANSLFCSCCGDRVEQPLKTSSWTPPSANLSNSAKTAGITQDSTSLLSNASTQTFGLFYPSSAELRRRAATPNGQPSGDVSNRERAPFLTLTSPGRGYWRKQLDHIFAHFKVYTNNNPEFRTAIGEPRLGKLLSADLDNQPDSVSITLTYALANPRSNGSMKTITCSRPSSCKSNQSIKLSARTRFDTSARLKRNDEKHHGSDDDGVGSHSKTSARTRPASDTELDKIGNCGKSKMKQGGEFLPNGSASVVSSNKCGRKRKQLRYHGEAGVAQMRQSKLATVDQRLLKLLGDKNVVSTVELEGVLKEGANPNCVDPEGNTPLMLTVLHRKPEAISILVRYGAKVNAGLPPRNDTPLHAAVRLGYDGVDLVEQLLECGADPWIKNARQESPHSITIQTKCEPIVRLLATEMGKQQIRELTGHDTQTSVTSIQAF